MYISFECKILIQNENASQWDAYCPLVDRIPACTVAGGGVPAQGGVPARSVYLSDGVYLLRGVYLPRGRGCTCQGVPAQVIPPVDRQTSVKT